MPLADAALLLSNDEIFFRGRLLDRRSRIPPMQLCHDLRDTMLDHTFLHFTASKRKNDQEETASVGHCHEGRNAGFTSDEDG